MNEPSEPQTRSKATQPALGLIRTSLLMAGSALLGGLAVVLWNRKSLASLRQPVPEPNRSPKVPDAEVD